MSKSTRNSRNASAKQKQKASPRPARERTRAPRSRKPGTGSPDHFESESLRLFALTVKAIRDVRIRRASHAPGGSSLGQICLLLALSVTMAVGVSANSEVRELFGALLKFFARL